MDFRVSLKGLALAYWSLEDASCAPGAQIFRIRFPHRHGASTPPTAY